MPRRHPQHEPGARYAVTGPSGAHRVVDRLHGYTLSTHTTLPAAEATARELASSPAAAIAAVESLDAAQTGPAAEERRTLRRYGYAWTLHRNALLTLVPECSDHRLEDLVQERHLTVVFSLAGRPLYCTPERWAQMSSQWAQEGSEPSPAGDFFALQRNHPQLERLPRREQLIPCAAHGIALEQCLLCGPREDFQCQWGGCRANRVTAYCERCARNDPHRAFPLPPPLDRG
jgi:hypothetical protein